MAPADGVARAAPRASPLLWTLAFLALFAGATGLIVSAMLWRTNDLLTGQVLQVIRAEARGLSEQYRNGGLPLVIQTVSDRSRQPGNGLYLLEDAGGIRLAGNLGHVPRAIRDDPSGGLFLYDPEGAAKDAVAPKRLALGLVIAIPARSVGGLLARSNATTNAVDDVHLILARDIEDIAAFAQSTRSILLVGIGATALFALAGAALYSRVLRRRVDAVTAASRRIMSGDLSQRLPVGGGDEIGRLSENLNVMLERIEQLLTGLREVSDNIAHDLKTPLTRLRNRAEAALRDSRGPSAHREGLERTLEEADELIKTFNALLAIARLEAGAGSRRAELCDIEALVRDTVDLYEPVAEEAGLRIRYVAPPASSHAALLMAADRQLVGQAVVNLIENAIKYGCADLSKTCERAPGVQLARNAAAQAAVLERADITVAVEARPGFADIVVADHGPGVPEADRARVLKRFVRLETSRTLPGTGLGLSLVSAVARLHDGTVRLEDNRPGLRVVLSLPVTSSSP